MNSHRIRRIGAILGASGCSIAIIYGTSGVLFKNPLEHAERGSDDNATGLVVEQDAGGTEDLPRDAAASQNLLRKERTKSMRQRVKDAVERRRTQQRFPWTGWWHLRKYRSGRVGQDDDRHVSFGDGNTSIHYPTGREVAMKYPEIVKEIRILAQNLLGSTNQLLSRFDDVELARYAVHYGILRIKDDNSTMREKARRMVVQDAAEGVADSQQWFQTHRFASIQEIHAREYSSLIRWEYTQGKHERPILHVDIGKAVAICRNKTMQLEFANIVLTMMELAALNSPLTGIVSPPPGGIDRIDVRIYAEGTNTMNATKTFWILRAVVKAVSHHYPGRLNTLVLYDLPIVLNWIVLGVKKLVHPETASKFSVHKT